MSEENVELIRSAYEPVNRGDWDAVFRHAHPEFELTTQQGPTPGTYRGRAEAQKEIQELLSPFEEWVIEPEEFLESGDQVVVLLKIRARPKGASVDMEVRIAHLWTVREDRILSLKTFAVREEALEAAGLRK
jgi:ketosteroid isomerase-like protein